MALRCDGIIYEILQNCQYKQIQINHRGKDLLPPRPAGSPAIAEPSTSAIRVPCGPIDAVYTEEDEEEEPCG